MPKPDELPFSHFSLTHSSSTAASRAWRLDLALPGERNVHVFGLVVLYEGPPENEQVITELSQRVQDTIRYHHQLLLGHNVSLTNEDFFEQCLQKINSEINVFLRDVRVALPVYSWGFALGMLCPDTAPQRWQVFLSRFGEVSAWLLHKAQLDTHKLISIFDTPDPITGTPGAQKYFKNIVSSSLSNQDQLLFCTPNVFNYISLSDAKRLLTELSAKSATRQLQNIMEEHLIDPVAAAMTVKLSPFKQAAGSVAATSGNEAEESMHTLIETQSETEKLLGTSASFGMGGIKSALKSVGTKIQSAMDAQSSKKGRKSAIGQVLAALIITGQKTGAALLPLLRIFKQKAVKTPMGKSEYVSIHGTVAKVSFWQTRIKPYLQPLGRALHGLFGLNGSRRMLRSPVLYGVLAVFIAGSFIAFRFFQKRQDYQQTVAAAQASLDQARSSLDRIDAHLIVGREADAVQLTREVAAALAAIPDDLEEFQQQKQAFRAKLDEQQRRLRKEIPVQSPRIVLDDLRARLNSAATFMAKEGESLVVVGQNPRTVVNHDLGSNVPSSKAITTDLTEARLAARDGDTVLISSGSAMASINVERGTSTTSATPNTQSSLAGLSIYNNRAYTVVPQDRQILRSNTFPNFSVFSPWLETPSQTLADARDLAIDGSIYVLTKTGLHQFAQNESVPSFKLDPVEPALADAAALSYEPENDFIFILESPRVLVFRKSGKFVAQYLVSSEARLIDLAVDEENSTAYVLTDNNVLSFPLQLAP